MSRPFKSGVDYFPLDVNLDDKVKILEAEQDIIGFAIWVKLHQKIYAYSYWMEWDKKAEIVFSKEVNVDRNKVNDVINSCIEWKIFDKGIYENFSVLTSRGIQKRYFKICERRTRIEVVKEYMLIDVPKIENQEIVIVDINSINSCKSTQSKVKRKETKSLTNTSNVFDDNSIEMKICKFFFSILQKSDENQKEPNWQSWCKDIDVFLRIDKPSSQSQKEFLEDIKKVILYAHDPANSSDKFSWIPNLRSPKKLRKHFQSILLQTKQPKRPQFIPQQKEMTVDEAFEQAKIKYGNRSKN